MSCLFNSMSHFLPESSSRIRQMICDYLQNGGKIMDGIDTKTILRFEKPNYIARMRQSSTWGGAIEIQAACNIWKLRILVNDIRLRSRDPKIIEFLPVTNNFTKTIKLNWNGGHYTPAK